MLTIIIRKIGKSQHDSKFLSLVNWENKGKLGRSHCENGKDDAHLQTWVKQSLNIVKRVKVCWI